MKSCLRRVHWNVCADDCYIVALIELDLCVRQNNALSAITNVKSYCICRYVVRGDTTVFATLEDRCLVISPPTSRTESHPKPIAFIRAVH